MAAKPPFDRLKAYRPTAIVNAPPASANTSCVASGFRQYCCWRWPRGGLTGIIAAYQLNYSQAANEVAGAGDLSAERRHAHLSRMTARP
jgi:hypothetical protein